MAKKDNTCPHCSGSTVSSPCPKCGNDTLCHRHGCYLGCALVYLAEKEEWVCKPM